MRILAVNQFYWPDTAPTSQLLTDVCTHMAGLGHDIHVVAGQASYAGNGKTLSAEESHQGVRIHRVALPRPPGPSLLARGLTGVGFQAMALARALQVPRPDVVLVKSTPPLLAAVGLPLKARFRCRLVYWVQDLYPDVAVALGAVAADSPVAGAAALVARAVVRHSDTVVALGPAMRQRLLLHGAAPERVVVVDNWQDGTLVKPFEGAEHPLRQQWGTTDKCTVMYSGNLGLAHDVDTLAAGLERVAQTAGWDVVMVCDGAQRKALAERLCNHVRFLPLFPRDELPLSLTAPDIHLVSLHHALGGMVVPSKLYGVMCAGRPVVLVAPPDSDAWQLVERTGCGLTVRNGDVDGMVAALERLRSNPELRIQMGRAGRTAVDQDLGRSHALARWQAVLSATPLAAQPWEQLPATGLPTPAAD